MLLHAYIWSMFVYADMCMHKDREENEWVVKEEKK